MIEQISDTLSKISYFHFNILFLLGLVLFGGLIGGRLFQKLRIPQVVGYIAIGVAIGESGLKILSHDIASKLQPFSYFALGLIGFVIGGELKKEVFTKHGKQFLNILLSEGITAFLAVSLLVGIVGTFFFDDWRFVWSLALLLGAIASATAPAATTEVLREYKTRGPLTRTVLGIVAMDDGLALILFAIAVSIAGSLSGSMQGGAFRVFINPVYEISVSIFIGVIAGLVLSKLLRKYTEKERLLVFSIGTVLLVSGFSLAIHVDMLLAVMALGVVVTNLIPRKAGEVFKLLEGFTPPLYVLFFVLVGAELNISYMSLPVIAVGVAYLLARSAGKMLGANFGARISGAPKSVQRYLPLCLFSQAGVAIGLSILASNYFPGEIGNTIIVIVTATVFILEIIGPLFVKIAVIRSGEAGLNITEEDYMRTTRTKDIMDKNSPSLDENAPMGKILKTFSGSPNLYYPVVNAKKIVTGIISVDGIKNSFMEEDLSALLLAADLKDDVVVSISEESLLSEVREILDKYSLECLPVVAEEGKLVGFIERRMLDKQISTKLMELREKADYSQEVT